MGVSYEGWGDGRVVLQLHNISLRVLPGGTAVTVNDFSLPGGAVMLGSTDGDNAQACAYLNM